MQKQILKQIFPEMWASGASYVQIRKKLGISMRTIAYWRKELGLPNRKRGRKSHD
jgi:uncharacterized protein YjcR